MKKKMLKILTVMIIAVLVIHSGAQTVYGFMGIFSNGNKREKEAVILDSKDESFLADSEDEEEATILYEDIDKREQNMKHFLTDNGTFQAVIYPESVHYELDGKWEDIDNSLITAKNENGEEITRNNKNSFVVEFSNDIKEDTFNKREVLKVPGSLNEENRLNDLKIIIEQDETKGQETLGGQNELNEENELLEEVVEQEELTEQRNIVEEELIEEDVLIEEVIQLEEIDKRKHINDFKILSIQNNKFSMKWYMEDTNNTILRPIERNETRTKSETETDSITKIKELNNEKTELKNISSAVNYSNIMDNIDLEYDVKSDYIKETIVLKSRDGIRESFVFNMDMGDSTLLLNEDNSIDILDGAGEKVALIEAPYMFDSAFEYCNDIKVTLEKDENAESNIYRMEIIPSLEWLQDEERVYPVKIDPTIKTALDRNYIEDATIYSGNPNYQTTFVDVALKVGKAAEGTCRSLIKFNLPTLTAGDQVVNASLSIFGFSEDWQWWNPPPSGKQVNVHKVTSAWNWWEVCWTTGSEIYDSSRINDYNYFEPTTAYYWGENVWDITTIAKDWYVSGNNYGLMIKEDNDIGLSPHEPAFYISSKIGSNLTEARPMAIIEYRNQTGLENYLSYHTQDVGRAGTIHTNDYNGNVVLTHHDAATPGSRMPVAINHVYNTNYSDNNSCGVGNGFRLNLSQELMPVNIGGINYTKYTDEDGTIHYFTSDGKDEDGLGLTLSLSNNIYTITDKGGNKSQFTKTNDRWFLTKITDTNNNNIVVTRNGAYITSVTDAMGDTITLNYSNNLLSSIVDAAGRATNYNYTNDNLTNIIYPDGKMSCYTYMGRYHYVLFNLLETVRNIDNSSVKLSYYNRLPFRAKSIKEYSTNDELGNSLEIEYGQNTTTFTDNKGYSQTMTFNNWGNAISIADFGKEPENINNAYGKSYRYGNNGGAKNKLTLEGNLISSNQIEGNLIQNGKFDNGLNNWTGYNTNVNDKVVSMNGNNVFGIAGAIGTDKNLNQTISVSGVKGDVYNISAWVQANGVPNDRYKTANTRISVFFNLTNGTQQICQFYVDTNSSGWQYISEQIVANNAYTSMKVHLIYTYNTGITYFDNIALVKDISGNSYQYDSKGNLVNAQDLAKQNNTFSYDGNDQLINNTNPKGGTFDYQYDANYKNRLLKATSSIGVDYNFTYNQYGQATNSKIKNGVDQSYIETQSEYSADGKYLIKTEDQEGNETNYAYSTNTGTTSKVTNAKGIDTNYIYDTMDRLKNVSQSEYSPAGKNLFNKQIWWNNAISVNQGNLRKQESWPNLIMEQGLATSDDNTNFWYSIDEGSYPTNDGFRKFYYYAPTFNINSYVVVNGAYINNLRPNTNYTIFIEFNNVSPNNIGDFNLMGGTRHG